MKQSQHEKSNLVSGRSSSDNRGTDLGLSSPGAKSGSAADSAQTDSGTLGKAERAEASLPSVGLQRTVERELLAALKLLLEDSKEFHDEPDAEELRSGSHTGCGWCVARAMIAKVEDGGAR